MPKKILRFIVILFLVPVFFVLHGYNESFGLIPVSTVWRLWLIYSLITAGLVIFSLALLRVSLKAVAFAFFLALVYFFFGAFHDFLKAHFGAGFIGSYTFLLPFLFVFTLALFIWLKKMIQLPIRLVRYLTYVLFVLSAIEVGSLFYNAINGKARQNDLTSMGDVWMEENACKDLENPDIFFVVFDGYTSSKCLREEFNYDNSEIDSVFRSNHFFVSENSRGNYNVTPFSLSSTLDGQYLKPALENKVVTSTRFVQAMETLRKNYLTSFLKKKGYDIKNYGCFELSESPLKTNPYFEDAGARQIDNQTIVSRVVRDIGWNFAIKNIFTGTFRIPAAYKRNKAYHLYRNRFNWQGLLTELKTQSGKPKFVYAHLMLPHEPFYLDSAGKEISDTLLLQNNIDQKQGYLAQVKYCNQLLKQMVPLATSKTHRSKVVIIEGDHGYRFYNEGERRQKEFPNLNAYFFSDHDYNQLYDNISPVNSFRVVFNKYFCQSYPLLKDRSIFLINDVPVK